jgi:hypothetical protein
MVHAQKLPAVFPDLFVNGNQFPWFDAVTVRTVFGIGGAIEFDYAAVKAG